MTNSASTSDQSLARWAYEAHLPQLAGAGAEVWEYQGDRTLHDKIVVADGRHVFIGSHNQDPRSQKINKEVGILADAPELGARILERGARLRKNSLLASRNGKLTASKRTVCGPFCRLFSRYLFRPVAEAAGLNGQI